MLKGRGGGKVDERVVKTIISNSWKAQCNTIQVWFGHKKKKCEKYLNESG